jgi:hypothetical protein
VSVAAAVLVAAKMDADTVIVKIVVDIMVAKSHKVC